MPPDIRGCACKEDWGAPLTGVLRLSTQAQLNNVAENVYIAARNIEFLLPSV